MLKSKKKNKTNISRFDRNKEAEKLRKGDRIFVRKMVKTPFPTNYLPTIPLKLSSIMRYYQMKSAIKKADRQHKKEREIEISKYSVLVKYLEEEIEIARSKFIESNGKTSGIILFKINYRFDDVLSKIINYLNYQDNVELVSINENYEKILKTPPARMLVVKLHEYMEVNENVQ